jgi:hypothetical protein
MSMSTILMVATGLAGLNVVLLLALGSVWVRNYVTFRTPLILGLVAFAAVMLVQNVVAIYFFFSMGSLYAMNPAAHTLVAALRGLEFVALAILTAVTLK